MKRFANKRSLLQDILKKCNSIEAKMNLILAGDNLKAANQALKMQTADENKKE